MSKVASAAASLGVGEDQLAAQLSTIISVTRQAPETVGTALRTVYARITDIQAGLDEDGVTLGKYSGDMAKIGISVLDLNGNLRNMGEVMEEIGSKWSTMTQEQKIYLAQTMAGQRQYSNLMALFDNFDKYESALKTAQNAGGRLQEQQDIYMDRLSTHVQQLTTATEHMWMGLTDTDGFKDVIDGLTTIVEKVDKLFQSIGGGKNLLQSLVPIVMSLTSKTVANGINTMIINSQLEKRQLRDQKSSQVLAQNEMEALQKEGQQGSQRYQVFKQKSEFLQAAPGTFSAQQMDEINKRWTGSLEAADAADKMKAELDQYSDITQSITTVLGDNPIELKKTLSIEGLETAITDVSGQYNELSKKIEQYARDQDVINKQQDAARQKLIEAYSQSATKIASEKNDSQFKQFNSKNLRKYESTQAQIISHEQQKLDALSKSHNDKKQVINDSALTGIFNIKRNRKKGDKVNDDQISEIEKVKGFEEVQDIKGKKEKIKKIKEIFENSIYKEIYEQMHPKSAADFKKAVRNRYTEIEKAIQQASNKQKAANQELLRRQQMTNTYQQNFQALKGNLQIQNIDKFQNNLQFLSQDFSSMAIPPELKKQLESTKKEYQELSQAIADYNQKIQSSFKLSQEQIDELKKERKALEEKQQALLDNSQGVVDDINEEVQRRGQKAIKGLKDSRTVGNNNEEGIKDIQDDADRQKAIQSLIQLASGISQAIAGFQSLIKIGDIWSDNAITTTEKINQIFSNLLINLPMIGSGIVSVVTALKSYDEITKLLKTDLTLNLEAKLQHLAVDAKSYYLTIKNSAANLGFAGTLKAVATKFKEVTASAATSQMTLGSFLVVIAAVTTAILIYKTAIQKNSKEAQAAIEQNKKLIEQEKEKQDLLANQKNIIDQLKEINKQYQDGAISRVQLKDKINELKEKYQEESDIIQKLTQDYNNLTDAIKNAQKDYTQEKYESDKRIADAKSNIARNTEQGEVKGGEWWRAASISQGLPQSKGSTVIQVGVGQTEFGKKLQTELQGRQVGNGHGNILETSAYGALKGTSLPVVGNIIGALAGYELGKNSLTQVDINDIQTKQQLQKVVQGLQAVVDSATEEDKNTSTYNSTMETLTTLQQQLKQWENADLAVLNDIAEKVIIAENIVSNFDNVNNFSDYQKAYQKSFKQMYDQLSQDEDFNKKSVEQQNEIIALKLESAIPKELKEQYSGKMDVVNRINHWNGAGFFGLQKTDDNILKLVDRLSEDQLSKFLSLDIEDIQDLDDVQRVLQTISEYDFKNLEFNTADAKKAAQTYNNMSNALQKVQNSKAISEKDFEENLGLTDEIKEYFRLGNNGYVLKDESQKETVKKLIREQQRSGWDEGYKVQQNIKENEQAWLSSGANKYESQAWTGGNLFQTLQMFITGNKKNFVDNNVTNAKQMIEILKKTKDEQALIQASVFEGFIKDGKISKQDYEEIYNYFNELSKKHKDAAKKIEQANEQQQEALWQIHESIFPTDDDVDKTLVVKLGQQFQLTAKKSELLDNALESNARKAKDVAEEVQRYNAALSSVIKNYATWQDKLSGSTANKLSVAPQIKDAMADTLGISESTLSDTFVTTIQNLEDMRLALEGDKDAYERLQQAAYEDILIHIGLDDADLNEVKTDLSTYFDGLKLEEIKVGAELDKDGLDEVLATLIAKGVKTEQQLEAIFASFNVDLDVVIEDGQAIIKSYTKAATHELKEQQKSQEELNNLKRERIKNQKELTKFLKDERDIYHEINRLLSDQERTIKRITRNQQDMYGTELLDNLNAESAEYKKQEKLLKSKQRLQQQDLANKRAALMSKGASFDANGNISNYNNLIGNATNNVNAIISRERGIQNAMNQHLLNGGSTSDETYKNLDAQLSSVGRQKSQANDYLNDLKTDLSNYEKVKDQAEDVADQLTELSEKQIEINLKKFNMKLELTLDLSQATKTWNDYKRNVLQHDDIFNPNRALSAQKDNAQRLADINSDSRSLDIVNQQIEKAMADNGTLYKTQGQKKKAIEELQKKAIQLRKGILETEDAIKQTYLDQYNIIKETFEKQKSQYEFINNQLEHNKNLMKLVYGEEDYAIQNLYNDKMIQNNLQLIESMNNRIKIAESNLQEAKKSGDIAVIEAAKAEWQTAIQNRNQLEEQSIQLMKDRYIAAINQISHQMEMKLTNNKGFSYLDTEWDLLKKKSNLYLDDINSAFAIKDVQYNYIQALNDVKGLKNQQQLKKVMDQQLSILKEKDKLTQYDVDRAEKVLEIEKARIALEQARNNKTQMRLKRDSQGNYSYQYVADQDEIAKAEQELNKAENDLYNFDKENYQNNLEEAYNATKEYHEKIAALNEEWNKASVKRRVKIEKELKLLEKEYSNYIINLTGETEWTKQNLMDSAAQSAIRNMGQQQIAFENMSNAQKQKWLGDMVPSINSGIAKMIGKFSTDPDSFKQIVIDATQAMDNERKTYQQGLADLQEAAGQNWNNIKQAIDPVVELQDSLIEDNDRLKNQAGEIVGAMNGTLNALKTQADKWQTVYDKTNAAVLRVYDYIAAVDKAALKKLDQNSSSNGGGKNSTTEIPTVNSLKTFGNTAPNAGASNATGTSKKNNDNPLIDESVKMKDFNKGLHAIIHWLEDGNTFDWWHGEFRYSERNKKIIREFLEQFNNIKGRYRNTEVNIFYNKAFANSFIDVWNKKYGNGQYNIKKFDTGGYTGDWSSTQGKLAVLHQKELVLNKQDTANMLEMIQMVREMQQNELKMRMTQLNNEIQDIVKQTNQVGKIQSQTDSIEQSVKIAATFPNVNSKKEIEEALINLTNKAAQFALKYKK